VHRKCEVEKFVIRKHVKRPETTRLSCIDACCQHYECYHSSEVWGGTEKSLARPTSRCRRTESIVSLERGVCSCVELQVLLVTEAEGKHVRRRARFQQHRDASCHQVFYPARKGAEGNSRHSGRNIRGTCTLVCHRKKLGGPV